MPTDNREALLKGARICIEQIGYARTTARDVASAAGVSLGAIGYHFGSKEELLNEAIAEGFRDWISSFATLIGDARAQPARDGEPAGPKDGGGAAGYRDGGGAADRAEVLPVRLEELVGRAISEFFRLMETSRPLLIAFIEALAQAEHVPVLRAQLAEQYRQSRAVGSEMITAAIGPSIQDAELDPATLSSLFIALVDGLVMQFLMDPESTPGPASLLALYRAGASAATATVPAR